MVDQQIRYSGGANYERTIGKCGRLAGEQFIWWLAPSPDLSGIGAVLAEDAEDLATFAENLSETRLSFDTFVQARVREPAPYQRGSTRTFDVIGA